MHMYMYMLYMLHVAYEYVFLSAFYFVFLRLYRSVLKFFSPLGRSRAWRLWEERHRAPDLHFSTLWLCTMTAYYRGGGHSRRSHWPVRRVTKPVAHQRLVMGRPRARRSDFEFAKRSGRQMHE